MLKRESDTNDSNFDCGVLGGGTTGQLCIHVGAGGGGSLTLQRDRPIIQQGDVTLGEHRQSSRPDRTLFKEVLTKKKEKALSSLVQFTYSDPSLPSKQQNSLLPDFQMFCICQANDPRSEPI